MTNLRQRPPLSARSERPSTFDPNRNNASGFSRHHSSEQTVVSIINDE